MPLAANRVQSNPLKRKLADFDEVSTPVKILRTGESKSETVLEWLSDLTPPRRSTSAPPSCDNSMSQHVFAIPQAPTPSVTNDSATTDNTQKTKRSRTGSDVYPEVLEGNCIIIDRIGKSIPQDVMTFLQTDIFKERKPISQQDIQQVRSVVEEVIEMSEDSVHRLLETPLFPTSREGIVRAGKSQWSTQPLPRGEDEHGLAAPKPDLHFGYPRPALRTSTFTKHQKAVINHSHMRPYTRPTSDNTFPFLILELKSDAKSGSIYHAENQAASAGAHRVSSMRQLHLEAGKEPDILKTLVFSICMNARHVHLYVHYYSAASETFSMSPIEDYSILKPVDIQKCNWHIQNILDFGLGTRLIEIEHSLDALWPFPARWSHKKQRRTGSASVTPSTSFSASITGQG